MSHPHCTFLGLRKCHGKKSLWHEEYQYRHFFGTPSRPSKLPSIGPNKRQERFCDGKCFGKFVRAALWDDDWVNAAENSHRGGET